GNNWGKLRENMENICNKNGPVLDQQVEMVKNAFWEYVSNTFISQSSEAVTRFSDALRTQDLLHKFNREARQMQKRLEKDLSTFSNKLKPFTDELMGNLQKQVRTGPPYVADSLTSSLMQKTRSMNLDLQAQMGPMKQKMEESFGDFQRSLSFAPYGEEIRTKFDLEAENMRKQLETLWKSFTKTMQ
uniref:Apolipoprotein A-IV n=1 Tax=Neogobius melanostomus TaxID=47308 RepID=A0A8C6T9D7_9GOBI